jgi:hypothetical protein
MKTPTKLYCLVADDGSQCYGCAIDRVLIALERDKGCHGDCIFEFDITHWNAEQIKQLWEFIHFNDNIANISSEHIVPFRVSV